MRISDWSSDVCSSDLLACLLAHDDFHQAHAIDWREEMNADKLVRPFRCLRELRYGKGGRVGGEYCAFGNDRFRLAGGFGLDGGIFKHRFHDQVATFQLREIVGRRERKSNGRNSSP